MSYEAEEWYDLGDSARTRYLQDGEEDEMGDINYWYRIHEGICPNCGTILKDLDPAANLYPHWTGGCRELNRKRYTQEQLHDSYTSYTGKWAQEKNVSMRMVIFGFILFVIAMGAIVAVLRDS